MLSSVFARDHGRPVHVHLLSDGIAPRDLRRMERLAQKAGGALSVYDLRSTLAAFGPAESSALPHVTRAAVARLFFDRFLERDSGKILYLDSDIVCIAPLHDLWLTDLGDAIVGAVPNGPSEKSVEHKQLLGLPAEHPYANSGVLLIDIARWRAAEIGNRARDFIRRQAEPLPLPDQDALNVVLGPRLLALSPCWNFQPDSFPRTQERPIALIHFAGAVKPWFAFYRRAFAAEFREAKRQSPWRWTPPVIPWARIFRRWCRSLGKRRRRPAPTAAPTASTLD